ncbi:hypothetical protein GXW82_03315 [Streptacidiphilus sp. 4-A2]|nr:hypothetical protein [Streptacidiphilus sp. 4-A2]
MDWAAVLPAGRLVELPTYAFQHQYYWPGGPQRMGPGTAAPAGGGTAAEARFWPRSRPGTSRTGRGGPGRAGAAGRGTARADLLAAARAGRVGDRPVALPDHLGTGDRPAPSPAVRQLAGRRRHGHRRDGGAVRPRPGGAGASALPVELGPGELDRESIAARIAAAVADTAPSGVLSLLALTEGTLPGWDAVPAGTAGTLALLQPWATPGWRAAVAADRGAVAAAPADLLTAPVQAQIWGLGQVAALEHPDRWAG